MDTFIYFSLVFTHPLVRAGFIFHFNQSLGVCTIFIDGWQWTLDLLYYAQPPPSKSPSYKRRWHIDLFKLSLKRSWGFLWLNTSLLFFWFRNEKSWLIVYLDINMQCRLPATVRCISHPSAHVRALSTSVLRAILHACSMKSSSKQEDINGISNPPYLYLNVGVSDWRADIGIWRGKLIVDLRLACL